MVDLMLPRSISFKSSSASRLLRSKSDSVYNEGPSSPGFAADFPASILRLYNISYQYKNRPIR